MSYYFPSAVPITDDIGQLERWLRNEFQSVQVSSALVRRINEFIASNYVIAGYGGIGLNAETALDNIDETPQIMPFDVELIANPRGVGYGLANNGLIFEEVGVWRMNAKVSLTFLELNAGRRMTLRLFDINKGTDVGPSFNFAIGRNTDGVNLNFNLLVTIPEVLVGDTLVLRVSSATSGFTGVTAIGSIWDANLVSEYQGDFFDRETGARTRWQ